MSCLNMTPSYIGDVCQMTWVSTVLCSMTLFNQMTSMAWLQIGRFEKMGGSYSYFTPCTHNEKPLPSFSHYPSPLPQREIPFHFCIFFLVSHYPTFFLNEKPLPISAVLFVLPPLFVSAYRRINRRRESATPSSAW